MNKTIALSFLIPLLVSLTGCLGSNNQLEATNQALNQQVNALSTQVAQQALATPAAVQEPVGPGIEIPLPTQTSALPPTQSALPTIPPSPIPTIQSPQALGIVAPALIVSGSGEITPWKNTTPYPMGLFGAANVHLVCDPSDTTDGKVWIDDQSYSVSCNANSESWALWKPMITVGDHYIYSQNAADKYEFWTVGTTPFTVHNTREGTDYMFNLPQAGIYNLTTNLIKGSFDVYLTCEGAQNFNYKIIQSTTIQVVLNPARCELIVRDSPPGTLNPGEIEVSLEFYK